MDKVIANVQQHNYHAFLTHQFPRPFIKKPSSIDLKEEVGDGLRWPSPCKVSVCPASPQKRKSPQEYITSLDSFIMRTWG